MRLVLLRASAVCCLILGAGHAVGQDGAETLRLADAIAKSLKQHPSLRGFVFNTRIQDAQVSAATLRPLPQAELVVEDFAGTGAHSGLSAAQTTLSLSQLIELGGKREGRIAVAEAARTGLRTRLAAQQLDVVAEVARRFVAVLEGQARLDIAAQGLSVAENALAQVGRRVQAARAPPAESARAGAQLWEARLLLEYAEHELEIERHALAAAMGEKTATFGRAEGDLLQLSPVAAFPELVARLDSAPEFLQFADEERLRDAEIRLAEIRSRPDLKATLGVRRLEQNDDIALVAGVSLPLFTKRTAQPQIDAARAARERIGVDRESVWLATQSSLFSQYQQLEHSRGLANVLRAELIPRLETALEQTAYAYERGRYSYLEWTTAQQDLLDARRRLVQAAKDFHILRIEIERVTGESLDATGVRP